MFLLDSDYWRTTRIIVINQGSNLQNYIIFLLLYQKSTTTSDATTNPLATVVADGARGGRGRGRSNYRGRRKSYSIFRNRTYSNNQGGPRGYRNSRRNSKGDYLGSS
jgi:hypothetical protein